MRAGGVRGVRPKKVGWVEVGTDRSFQTSLFLLHPPKIQSPVAVFFRQSVVHRMGRRGEKKRRGRMGSQKKRGGERVGVV